MFERSRIKESLAIVAVAGLGAMGLTGCGLSRHGNWKIGVKCPRNDERATVNYIDQEHDFKGRAGIAISCDKGALSEAPADMELFGGSEKDLPVRQLEAGAQVLNVYYTYEGGIFAPGSQSTPQLPRFSTVKSPNLDMEQGYIALSGIAHIDSASVSP